MASCFCEAVFGSLEQENNPSDNTRKSFFIVVGEPGSPDITKNGSNLRFEPDLFRNNKLFDFFKIGRFNFDSIHAYG